MKILVSNFGRQYTNALLIALERKGWLSVFFTGIAANKLPLKKATRRIRQVLRKRLFSEIPVSKIVHFPVLFALERLLRSQFPHVSRMIGDQFDRQVAQQLKRLTGDLVITYENTNRATMRTAKQLGKVTVLDLAQIHQEDIVQFGRWFMSTERLHTEQTVVNPRKATALQHTDYVLALSSFAADSMVRNGWPPERLFIVNLGIDPQRFVPKKHYRREGPLQLLFVGTMTKRKGLEILFEAIKTLPANTVELTLIGPMADAKELLNANRAMFRYLPFQHHEALAKHLQQADVFVFPSLLDSWAQTVVEAMACGTPAIVTENTGARDAVRQGGGWVIPPNDTGALRDCLVHCLQNRAEVELKGLQAHRIAQQYTWAHYYGQLEDCLVEIARRENIST